MLFISSCLSLSLFLSLFSCFCCLFVFFVKLNNNNEALTVNLLLFFCLFPFENILVKIIVTTNQQNKQTGCREIAKGRQSEMV